MAYPLLSTPVTIYDGLVKIRKFAPNVMPAKAGIQEYQMVENLWTPAFAGVTTSYETVIYGKAVIPAKVGIRNEFSWMPDTIRHPGMSNG